MRVFSNTPRPLAALEAWIRAKEYRQRNGGPLLIIDEHGNPVLDKRGKPRLFRLTIVASGGGLSGVFQAGMLEALADAGFSNDAVGYLIVSAAVSNVLAFQSGCAHHAVPFYIDLVRRLNEFIRLLRISTPRMRLRDFVINPMLDILNLTRLRESGAQIYTVVTEWETGKGRVVRLKIEEGHEAWVDVTQAAMTLPNLSSPVALKGIVPGDPERVVLCVDGACSLPLPLGEALRIMRPTHVLILGTRPRLAEVPAWEMNLFTWLAQLGLWNVPTPIRQGMLRMEIGVDEVLKRMHKINQRIECTALFPKSSDTIPPFPFWPFIMISTGMAKKAGENGKNFMMECLDRARMAIKRHSDDVPAV